MLALEDSDKKTTGLALKGFRGIKTQSSLILIEFCDDEDNSFYTALPFTPLPTMGGKRACRERGRREGGIVKAATTSTPVRRESTGFIAVQQVHNE